MAGDMVRFVDVVITSPTSAHVQANQGVRAPGRPAREAANRKWRKYRDKYDEDVSRKLVPLAIESSGRLCQEASAFIDLVASLAADNLVALRAKTHLYSRIGKLLATGNGKLPLLSRNAMLPVLRVPPPPLLDVVPT